MDKAGTGGTRLHRLNRPHDLSARVAGERIHNLRHRPNAITADMRASDSFARAPLKEPRIVLTPYEGSCSRIGFGIG